EDEQQQELIEQKEHPSAGTTSANVSCKPKHQQVDYTTSQCSSNSNVAAHQGRDRTVTTVEDKGAEDRRGDVRASQRKSKSGPQVVHPARESKLLHPALSRAHSTALDVKKTADNIFNNRVPSSDDEDEDFDEAGCSSTSMETQRNGKSSALLSKTKSFLSQLREQNLHPKKSIDLSSAIFSDSATMYNGTAVVVTASQAGSGGGGSGSCSSGTSAGLYKDYEGFYTTTDSNYNAGGVAGAGPGSVGAGRRVKMNYNFYPSAGEYDFGTGYNNFEQQNSGHQHSWYINSSSATHNFLSQQGCMASSNNTRPLPPPPPPAAPRRCSTQQQQQLHGGLNTSPGRSSCASSYNKYLDHYDSACGTRTWGPGGRNNASTNEASFSTTTMKEGTGTQLNRLPDSCWWHEESQNMNKRPAPRTGAAATDYYSGCYHDGSATGTGAGAAARRKSGRYNKRAGGGEGKEAEGEAWNDYYQGHQGSSGPGATHASSGASWQQHQENSYAANNFSSSAAGNYSKTRHPSSQHHGLVEQETNNKEISKDHTMTSKGGKGNGKGGNSKDKNHQSPRFSDWLQQRTGGGDETKNADASTPAAGRCAGQDPVHS
ncbi:unnamed protein product, partial [Amoebophrya sp. A120]